MERLSVNISKLLITISILLMTYGSGYAATAEASKVMRDITQELAIVSGKAPNARTDAAKENWRKKLSDIEQKINNIRENKENYKLTGNDEARLKDDLETINDMRDLLK